MAKRGTSGVWRQVRGGLALLGLFTVALGIIYPLVVTGIAQGLFRHQANGSLIQSSSQTLGSELIGQPFSDPKYFWGRLSATTPFAYNAASSSGSNYGPTNPALRQAIEARLDALRTVDPGNNRPVPVDLVTYSGSGLDPDISVAAADYQVARIARYRGLTVEQVSALVDRFTEGRQLGILGEPRVNVLRLNLALDTLQ
jgi:K+-transporting ATPase ATPase C chain